MIDDLTIVLIQRLLNRLGQGSMLVIYDSDEDDDAMRCVCGKSLMIGDEFHPQNIVQFDILSLHNKYAADEARIVIHKPCGKKH